MDTTYYSVRHVRNRKLGNSVFLNYDSDARNYISKLKYGKDRVYAVGYGKEADRLSELASHNCSRGSTSIRGLQNEQVAQHVGEVPILKLR